jgi:sterol desaturase/sphingolipid hydroxylase (fatty acid hydroxylase superfamily)
MIWKANKYHLEDMTLSELVVAYFQYPAIQAYFVLAVAGVGFLTYQQLWSPMLFMAGLLVAFLYPLIWYLLHRFVLHSNFLYKSPQFAKVWKRIHYDHHQDPNDLRVLFGALHTTLPTVAMFSVPVGWAMAGLPGAIAGMSAGVLVTMFYEFCHCIQHLHYTPKNRWLRDMKRVHLLHHFRNEMGNYGITNFFWDRVFKTYYDKQDNWEKSPSVFNLGYDEEQAKAYPWVAELSQQSNAD